jgi:hypothetical protein
VSQSSALVYRLGRFDQFSGWLVLATSTISAVAGLVVGNLFVFGAGTLLLGWFGYWFLFRLARRLELTPVALSWRAPLGSGSVAVDGISRIRPALMVPIRAMVLEAADSRVIVPDFLIPKTFLEEMARLNTGIVIRRA